MNNREDMAVGVAALLGVVLLWGALSFLGASRFDWTQWSAPLMVVGGVAVALGSVALSWVLASAERWRGRVVAGVALVLVAGVSALVWGREALSGATLSDAKAIAGHLEDFPWRYEEGARAWERLLLAAPTARLDRLVSLRDLSTDEGLGVEARRRLTAGVLDGVCGKDDGACRAVACGMSVMAWPSELEVEAAVHARLEGRPCSSRELGQLGWPLEAMEVACKAPAPSGAELFMSITSLHQLGREALRPEHRAAMVEGTLRVACEQGAACCRATVCAAAPFDWSGTPGIDGALRELGVGECQEGWLASALASRTLEHCQLREPWTRAIEELSTVNLLLLTGGLQPEPGRALARAMLAGICAQGSGPDSCCQRQLARLKDAPLLDHRLEAEVDALADEVGVVRKKLK